ncbi:bifunctional 4-hydroxy-2-oxoglutarate aldolase/2-dehydro-3-deoxy-phosphogluconate aldolase [Cryobacterium sp. Hz9]|nr:bifunctional 4-hydroxy-2-oxoglutarate aldolase/2-dehydro-3-deoxy-phosphogluconate aldolase [Cryobacterium sp. Hz9]
MRQHPIIAVLRASAASDYDPVVDVLAENGVRSIELTLSTPGTFEHLPALLKRLGDDVEVGIGTIVTVGQAEFALAAGAHYLVTPIVNLDVIALAVREGIPVFPGGLTPTELYGAWAAGATAVKIFPAETVGPQYGSHLRGPFPDLEFVPSGGIGLDDIPRWLNAGALAVSLGGPLVGDALKGGSLVALAERAQRVTGLAADALAQR